MKAAEIMSRARVRTGLCSLRSKHEVVADHVQFLGSPARETESAEEPASVA